MAENDEIMQDNMSKAEQFVIHMMYRLKAEPRLAWYFVGKDSMDHLLAAEAERQKVDVKALTESTNLLTEEPPDDCDYSGIFDTHKAVLWQEILEARNRRYLEQNAGDTEAVLRLDGKIEGLEFAFEEAGTLENI